MESQVVQNPTELDLLKRAKAGDYSAFQHLIQDLQPRVYGLVFRILRQAQDAEDATQQAFLALIEHIQDFRQESSLATWVMKIASNAALKILRKKRGLKTISMSEMHSEESYHDIPHPELIAPWSKRPDEIAQQAEVRAELDQALLDLDDKYRLVFILRDIEGLSIKETAEAMELTEATVKVRLLRTRLALRERLTHRFGDFEKAVKPDHHPT